MIFHLLQFCPRAKLGTLESLPEIYTHIIPPIYIYMIWVAWVYNGCRGAIWGNNMWFWAIKFYSRGVWIFTGMATAWLVAFSLHAPCLCPMANGFFASIHMSLGVTPWISVLKFICSNYTLPNIEIAYPIHKNMVVTGDYIYYTFIYFSNLDVRLQGCFWLVLREGKLKTFEELARCSLHKGMEWDAAWCLLMNIVFSTLSGHLSG